MQENELISILRVLKEKKEQPRLTMSLDDHTGGVALTINWLEVGYRADGRKDLIYCGVSRIIDRGDLLDATRDLIVMKAMDMSEEVLTWDYEKAKESREAYRRKARDSN